MPSNKSLFWVLVAVLVLQTAGLIFMAISMNSKFENVNKEIASLKQADENQQAMNYYMLQSALADQVPVTLPKEKLVVFPDLGFALPYNDVTRTLRYTTYGNNTNVSSTDTIDQPTPDKQLGCSQLVRVSTTDGNPYSPWEESAGSVTLSNGKTLYFIAAKAFENNEASTMRCAKDVWITMTPQKVVDELKKATAY